VACGVPVLSVVYFVLLLGKLQPLQISCHFVPVTDHDPSLCFLTLFILDCIATHRWRKSPERQAARQTYIAPVYMGPVAGGSQPGPVPFSMPHNGTIPPPPPGMMYVTVPQRYTYA
jgi:hypothetical protein